MRYSTINYYYHYYFHYSLVRLYKLPSSPSLHCSVFTPHTTNIAEIYMKISPINTSSCRGESIYTRLDRLDWIICGHSWVAGGCYRLKKSIFCFQIFFDYFFQPFFHGQRWALQLVLNIITIFYCYFFCRFLSIKGLILTLEQDTGLHKPTYSALRLDKAENGRKMPHFD